VRESHESEPLWILMASTTTHGQGNDGKLMRLCRSEKLYVDLLDGDAEFYQGDERVLIQRTSGKISKRELAISCELARCTATGAN